MLTELGDHPRVSHSVYVAALWPHEGQSVGDLLGGQFPDWMTAREDGAVRVLRDEAPADYAPQPGVADIERLVGDSPTPPRVEVTKKLSELSPPGSTLRV